MSNISPEQIAQLSDEQVQQILTQALSNLLDNQDLPAWQMHQVMLIIMQGRCPDALMGAILIALRQKGESIDEIVSCANAMLELANTIEIDDANAVDIVGTGGDGSNLFNVSTASAFVAAAAGVSIAKHGNRGVSTSSGSSDLLSLAGLRLDIDIAHTRDAINQLGIGFLFAPNHHPAMRHAIGVRQQLKARTIFNILGPLTNPARVKRAVVGVFDAKLCQPLAEVFAKLGMTHVMVVHSQDGLDEFSLATGTHVAELKHGVIDTYISYPKELGIASQDLQGLQVANAAESLNIIQNALAGTHNDAITQKARAMIAINAGAAIYVAGLADTHAQGVAKAMQILSSSAALDKLNELAQFTQSVSLS
ncbi:anthranilate phosphoribosyltransferase [Moraxella cuniculi]|uniref:Anthranilate phosphoribosyltransferase n=1 Tax=Moraxella cuniculi TaxID=34061 RepID=A0A448GXA6_9GAMM|nr:anthranilate phosphoribosyltransferase [Moraxella cuniculi]VEG13405.1 Anthranilate synthase component II [Moraxella cuniculi]